MIQYPQTTYGLGSESSKSNEILMDYAYLRIHQYVLKKVAPFLYDGIGYNLDYHWNNNSTIEKESLRQISNYSYGINGTSTSSGLSLNLLYDNRINSINADKGFYTNAIFRQNTTILGSGNSYSSLYLDARKYLHFPNNSKNVLAFWTYNILTFAKNAPYLALPSSGWDTYGNMGRGYIQGRFEE